MNLINTIKQNKEFSLKNNVYYLKDNNADIDFEEIYLQLRKKEERLYSDEILKHLPEISRNHKHFKEWQIRKNSAEKFLSYLEKINRPINILETGCGNGWLTNMISKIKGTYAIGLDINSYELEQAARVFGKQQNLLFLKAHIFDKALDEFRFDIIVLAGSIQYFVNVRKTIGRLLKMLTPGGEIHIFDSPFYAESYLQEAKKNTQAYFTQIGFPLMAEHFHIHSFSELNNFNISLMFNPITLLNRIKRKIFLQSISPFYWFKIKV